MGCFKNEAAPFLSTICWLYMSVLQKACAVHPVKIELIISFIEVYLHNCLVRILYFQ